MSQYNTNDTMWVSNTQQVKVVKPLTVGHTQSQDSEYIVETGDNRIEVYEVETIDDIYKQNIGNRDIMISDNATCWLWGSRDYHDVAREHCDLLESAGINPIDLVEMTDNGDLRDYVREVIELAETAKEEA